MPQQPDHDRSAEDEMAAAAIDEHERDAPGPDDHAALKTDEWPPPPGPVEWRQRDGY